MSTVKSALVLVFDRLQAGFLGPYGNTWVETPAANRLASLSYLCEQALADSCDLARLYRSYWSGRHAASALENCESTESLNPSIIQAITQAGVATELLTDSMAVAQHPLAGDFSDRMMLDHAGEPETATESGATRMAQLLAAALARWQEQTRPTLMWVHAQSFDDAWDAPLELRRSLADEDDPPPPDIVAPPDVELARNFDPDELLGYVHAYAGQVMAWDECLGLCLEAIADSPLAADTLVIVTATRGFPLGEHGRIGVPRELGDEFPGENRPSEERLHEESLHVPLFILHPKGAGAMVRDEGLVQPPDLAATLLDWFQVAAAEPIWGRSLLPRLSDPDLGRRDLAVAVGRHERMVRTPAWMMRQSDEWRQLYAKPDDRWEVNEVSDRGADVVEELLAAGEQFVRCAKANDRDGLPALLDVSR